MTDPSKLTPSEVHAVASLLAAVKAGQSEEAMWWSARQEVMSALAKMRAQCAKGAS